jgi:hypothetical protein
MSNAFSYPDEKSGGLDENQGNLGKCLRYLQ